MHTQHLASNKAPLPRGSSYRLRCRLLLSGPRFRELQQAQRRIRVVVGHGVGIRSNMAAQLEPKVRQAMAAGTAQRRSALAAPPVGLPGNSELLCVSQANQGCPGSLHSQPLWPLQARVSTDPSHRTLDVPRRLPQVPGRTQLSARWHGMPVCCRDSAAVVPNDCRRHLAVGPTWPVSTKRFLLASLPVQRSASKESSPRLSQPATAGHWHGPALLVPVQPP